MKKAHLILVIVAVILVSFTIKNHQPVLYIIGDSTVKNGDGKTQNTLQGWGSFMESYFDTKQISIENHAMGGRSSRTFITEGRWDKVLANLQKGDYVLMQFGHNDSGPLDDTARARGTIKGIGSDSAAIYNPITKQHEVVHTYGWYMLKYINDAKAKGAIPIICSPIPRNDWKDGKVVRSNKNSYASWAKQVAEISGIEMIDLNDLLGNEYEKLGKEKTSTFFPKEHTHTNMEGAMFNANVVINEIKNLKIGELKKFLIKN